MKNNRKLAVIEYTERLWPGRGYGGGQDGEARRKKFRCDSMPEALYWLFGGRELGGLERMVYSWAAGGCQPTLRVDGKFLSTPDGWLEDLLVSLGDIPDNWGEMADGEAGEAEGSYSADIMAFLGVAA